VSEPRYPILVERLTGDQALRIACQVCPWETTITAEEIRNERNYGCPQCGGSADYKYEEADKCPNCGRLGFFSPVLNHCCSRVCMLQAEYAETLAAPGAEG
jgi:hypothetical protein